MFIKFTDIINNQTITVNTDHISYISHMEYSKFIFPEKDLNYMLTTNIVNSLYYRGDVITRTDNINKCVNIIFTSDLRDKDYDVVLKALEAFVDERKNYIIESAAIFKLTMDNGQTFYCNDTIYNTICNNNDNLVIET